MQGTAVTGRRACRAAQLQGAGQHINRAPEVQVDLRLPPEAQDRLKQRMARMSAVRDIDSIAASAALKAAYHDVTRKLILCKQK